MIANDPAIADTIIFKIALHYCEGRTHAMEDYQFNSINFGYQFTKWFDETKGNLCPALTQYFDQYIETIELFSNIVNATGETQGVA